MDGITRGLNNDINDFSKQSSEVTDAAERRVTQFKRWFERIVNTWYQDIIQASNQGTRQCLTDNFPYDSPGNLDKDCVEKIARCEAGAQLILTFL